MLDGDIRLKRQDRQWKTGDRSHEISDDITGFFRQRVHGFTW